MHSPSRSTVRKTIVSLFVLAFLALPLGALAQAPKDGLIVSDEEAKSVLKHSAETKRTIPDNMLRVVDMGSYQLGVAVIGRGKLAPTTPSQGNPNAQGTPCGEQRPGAMGLNGLVHNETDETYIVTSGGGTLILGGSLVNGRLSAPDSEVTQILNGRSCSGIMIGYTSRDLVPGDVVVIPIGTPHGFSSIPDHITYLSLRPDMKKVLQHGYVNPVLK